MKILVVEDEKRIANAIKKGLEQEFFIVDISHNGEEGYDLASTEDYDLIILDIMLPNMDGLTICDNLRKQEKVFTPILMLTARGELEDKVKGLNIGADDYLVKPFEFVELIARVNALIRRPKQMIQTIITISDLSLDTLNLTVKRSNQIINLSKKEFTLLKYMMMHKGQVMSKEHLINHVWDYDADILENTVEVYVGYIRNKIDKSFPNSKPLIHTIRGFGYKLE